MTCLNVQVHRYTVLEDACILSVLQQLLTRLCYTHTFIQPHKCACMSAAKSKSVNTSVDHQVREYIHRVKRIDKPHWRPNTGPSKTLTHTKP